MSREQIRILENIFQTIAESDSPKRTLDRIVRLIAEKMAIDVCSVYVYHPADNKLELQATVGLNPEIVGNVTMAVHEGLTGLVLERSQPVFVVDPVAHERFKYYQESGEKRLRTFLGLPLIYHQQALGVLVIQTIARDGISEADIPVFENIASQISATVAYTGLVAEIADRPRPAEDGTLPVVPAAGRTLKRNYLKGVSVFRGVAEGYAHYMPETIDFDQVRCTYSQTPGNEIARLESAIARASDQIRHIANQARELSPEESAIIEAHLMFLQDKSLKDKIVGHINDGSCAEYALKQTIYGYVEMFRGMENTYISERAADILDVGHRVLENLIGGGTRDNDPAHFKRETIVIAADLSAIDLLAIRQPNLKGIVLAKGGRTSHTVILAKSFEIPLVLGVDGVLETVRENDFLILDGTSGMVCVNPPEEILREHDLRLEERRETVERLAGLREKPATTLDGHTVHLGANIGLLSDTDLVEKYGADHIGLYRTEFPFMLRKTFPTETEQYDLYCKMIENSGDRQVTVRTFDTGGDKFLSYMDYSKENNPFLGWRSIRISLDMEDVFRTQIRAILRSSAHGRVQMMFPMISAVSEIKRVVAIVDEEKSALRKAGIAFDENIALGIMVEVPSAVIILERLLQYIDFVSIGTNDLVQYLLAVDRNNKKVAALYNVLHPSVIATLGEIIATCQRLGKSVSICGEAAADHRCIYLLVGMGITNISMAPAAIPSAKQFIRAIRRCNAEACLKQALPMEDAAAITEFLDECIRREMIGASCEL
ncbi:MAG: phosphoenolpyruvate--protein phosphotransferase [Thermodesulfobacteriota bacterium]|nr:phosphoenolpyruvate--protein phosphotransferase [Thermodesulfobacteriota bacterium]